jgi:hypothetical protein
MRASTSPGSAHATMLVSAGKGLAFQRRTSDGATSVHTSGGAGTAPRWVRLTRTGDVVTASASADGSTWAQVGSDTVVLPDSALIGLAVTSHDSSHLATGEIDSVIVSEGS